MVSCIKNLLPCFAKTKQPEPEDQEKAKWVKLGLSEDVFEQHTECARFLMKSKLIYPMIGFQHGLQLDGDGHPLIQVQGQLRRWEHLKDEIAYDPEDKQIKSSGYPGKIAQVWNYFHKGLVPVDRYHYDKPFPVHEVSQEVYDRLHTHAHRFFETNPEKDQGVPKDCILQMLTSPRRAGPNHPLFDNFSRTYPMHVWFRIIREDRTVYSFGYQLQIADQAKIITHPTSTMLATGDARIGMLDYEEFLENEGRYVTSIPISDENADQILERVQQLNAKQMRFNFARQNCAALVYELLPKEYEVDMRTSTAEVLWGLLPDCGQIPWIGPTLAKIVSCVNRIGAFAAKCTPRWVRRILLIVPKAAVTVAANLFMVKIGATKMTRPLESSAKEEPFYANGKIQNFSAIVTSWKDIFKESTSIAFLAKHFLDWQKKQSSTIFYPPGDAPEFVGLDIPED
jgi:Domain of unknown function (DUF4105)